LRELRLVLIPLGSGPEFDEALRAAVLTGNPVDLMKFFDVRVESSSSGDGSTPARNTGEPPACYFYRPSEGADAADREDLRRLGLKWNPND